MFLWFISWCWLRFIGWDLWEQMMKTGGEWGTCVAVGWNRYWWTMVQTHETQSELLWNIKLPSSSAQYPNIKYLLTQCCNPRLMSVWREGGEWCGLCVGAILVLILSTKICLGRRDCDCEVGFTIFCLLHDTSELIAITFTANLWMNQMVTKHHVFAAHCWYLVMFYMLMTIAGPGQGQLTDPKQNECSKQIFDLEKLRMINWASWDTVITLSVSWEKCLFANTMWEMSDVKLFSWNYYLTSVKQRREEPLPHAFTALHSLVSPPALASIIISIQVSLLSVSWATFYQQQSGCHICTWWRHDARDCVISRCDFQSILWIVNCGL